MSGRTKSRRPRPFRMLFMIVIYKVRERKWCPQGRYELYLSFKSAFSISVHLYTLSNADVRSIPSRFILCFSPIKSHALKHVLNTVAMDRNCPLCLDIEESKLHFICFFPAYNNNREKVIPTKFRRWPSLSKLQMVKSCPTYRYLFWKYFLLVWMFLEREYCKTEPFVIVNNLYMILSYLWPKISCLNILINHSHLEMGQKPAQ